MRNNEQIVVTTLGVEPFEISETSVSNILIYGECGYIKIADFPRNNSKLIETIHKAIIKFKKAGINNVVIDIRNNPGGYGSNFDELLSIFINKDKIPYMQSQRLIVSDFTLDYNFVKRDSMFQNVDFPQGWFYEEIQLDEKMYVDEVNYYVLVSKGTNSMAAIFVNILDYNDAAIVCGEPLMNNATRFGETIDNFDAVFRGILLSPLGVSTVEYGEFTKAIDRVLCPDIYIPYVASEYITGKDAVLEKLLEIIKNI